MNNLDEIGKKNFCRPSYCKYCNPDKKVCISIIDSDGNFIDRDRYDEVYVDTHNIYLVVEGNISIFSKEDLRYLKFLLGEKLKYGGDTVTEMLKYSELHNKIKKLLEENTINE